MYLEKLKNKFVKVLDAEHGAKVIQAFKDLEVDTRGLIGNASEFYYGVCDKGYFDHYLDNNGQEITLEDLLAMKEPEFTWGQDVECRDDDDTKWYTLRTFVSKHPKMDKYVVVNNDDGLSEIWDQCRAIEPKEYTRQEIADALKIKVEDLRIKD